MIVSRTSLSVLYVISLKMTFVNPLCVCVCVYNPSTLFTRTLLLLRKEPSSAEFFSMEFAVSLEAF